jgi:hypothetical protein
MARLRLSRLSVAETGAARQFFCVGGSTLTVLAEPGRGVRLGFRAGTCGRNLEMHFHKPQTFISREDC